MAATRQALRQEIGRLTGDMLKVTATAIGTTTTLIDKLRLYRGDGQLEGRIGWVTSGTAANLSAMVRVTGNTRSTFTVTFADTALPSATAVADVIELWNERGQGYYPDDVNSEMNTALAIAAGMVTSPDEMLITDFDYSDPYLTIPATWQYFGGVWYQGEEDIWREIPATDTHMDVDTKNRTVRLKGDAARRAHTYTVRLIGDVASTPLTLDSQSTSCDAEWLTAYVAYRLLFGAMRRAAGNGDDISTRMAFCKTQEEKARGKARNRPQGIARRLW